MGLACGGVEGEVFIHCMLWDGGEEVPACLLARSASLVFVFILSPALTFCFAPFRYHGITFV
jgi:hypothetical protein